jgi:hypothetical protein
VSESTAVSSWLILRGITFEEEGNPDSRINPALGLWDGFLGFGRTQSPWPNKLNYWIPFNKIPVLTLPSPSTIYTSNFDWQRGGDALTEVAGEAINTVQKFCKCII